MLGFSIICIVIWIVEEGKLELYYNKQKITRVDAIIPRIGNSATSYGSAVIRHFESMGVYSILGSNPLLQSRNKISCLQILAANGIKVPRTAISNHSYTAGFLLDQVGNSPHVLKLASGTHGMGCNLI